jgi:alanine dehydrogenase
MSITIGVLKEVDSEARVAMNSDSVATLINSTNNNVLITSGAGEKSSISNEQYVEAGATILPNNESVIKNSQIIVKIGKPTIEELSFFKEGQILFCFLNLTVNPSYTKELIKRKITAIGYELIYEFESNRYPILAPISELVGKVSYSIGSNLLSIPGSKGVFLGGLGSASRSKVVIFGAGNAGQAFMKMADNAGSRVVVFETDLEKTQKINSERPHIETMYPFENRIKKEIKNADLILGATFRGTKKVTRLISDQMLREMEDKSVFIDLTYENGGLSETTGFKENNHTYTVTKHNIVHYWMPNIATLVPKSATSAIAAPILKYLVEYLITTHKGAHNPVIENAIAVNNGVKADWIDLDHELEKEYRPEIEHLIYDENEDDYDLYQMMNQEDNNIEHNIFKKEKEYVPPKKDLLEDEQDDEISNFLRSKNKEKNNKDDDDVFSNFDFDDMDFDNI